MLALSLSLAACVGWGVADFLGGLKSRRLPALAVLFQANLFGTLLIALLVALRAEAPPLSINLGWAVLGGVTAVVAMYALYQGLAEGNMAIVAPISATGVLLPVIWGIARGEALSPLQIGGMATAVVGALFAAYENGGASHDREAGHVRRQLSRSPIAKGAGWAAASAFAVGFYLIFMERASQADPYWAAFIMRCAYGSALYALVAATATVMAIGRPHYPAIICIGVVDALAGFAYALATTKGLLSIVAVVGAVYPVVTVLLAAMVLGERPQRLQWFGVVLAVVGICLISA